MRRQLTAREWMLLGVLGVLLVICGYITLFYMPMTAERDRCIVETETCRMETEAARLRLEEKQRMERELEELFAAQVPPLSIPDYDNLQPVMFELNSILAGTENYTLAFGTVDTSTPIVRRSISMTFTVNSYASARSVLRQLHDSAYRCLLSDLSLSIGRDQGYVSVSGTIVFFEYSG